jgi:hypothetical protein
MLFATVCLLVMRLTSGLLPLHRLVLGFISLVMSIIYLAATAWDALLFPKWLAMLLVFHLGQLAGAAIRLCWDNTEDERT